MTPATLHAALRAAFDAGIEQGEDQATAYEWGSIPRQNADDAFSDLFEEWNAGPIADAIRDTDTDPAAATGEFIVALVNAYREGRLVEAPSPTDTSKGE